MGPEVQRLCDAVGQLVVARDFAGISLLLAPWLQQSLTADVLQDMVDAQAEGLPHPPVSWLASEGLADLKDLRKLDELGPPSQPLPAPITDANYRGWFCIQFAPDKAFHDEQNVCYDVWLLLVDHQGALRIGYLEAFEAT